MKRILIPLEIISYFMLAGLSFMIILPEVGACSVISTGAITCKLPIYEDLATLSMELVLISLFTGIPAFLAFLGVIFLSVRVFRALGWGFAKFTTSRIALTYKNSGHRFWWLARQVPVWMRSTAKWFGFLVGGILALGAVATYMEGTG